uniref:Uncharacterized protein n=1 Tax=Anguilla anguilla TaxID=7936 RepID=A0A0E9WBD2_ANGAN
MYGPTETHAIDGTIMAERWRTILSVFPESRTENRLLAVSYTNLSSKRTT